VLALEFAGLDERVEQCGHTDVLAGVGPVLEEFGVWLELALAGLEEEQRQKELQVGIEGPDKQIEKIECVDLVLEQFGVQLELARLEEEQRLMEVQAGVEGAVE